MQPGHRSTDGTRSPGQMVTKPKVTERAEQHYVGIRARVTMEGELEVDAAVPVAAAVSGDERVQPGVLPAGPYATLIHTGPPEDLVAANAALLRWGAESGAEWQMSGGRWAARLESSLTDPSKEPDRNKWQTEVAYRTA